MYFPIQKSMYYTVYYVFLKKMKVIYISLSKWKELSDSKTKVGKMKNQLYDQITAEKIKKKD